jgi:hypothetical protein
MKPARAPEGIVLWSRPEYGVQVYKPVLDIDLHRTYKRLGYAGAWRLTAIKSETLKQAGAQYFRWDLKQLGNGPHRGAIIEKLVSMCGAPTASKLKPNQLQTFYNFLQKLKY